MSKQPGRVKFATPPEFRTEMEVLRTLQQRGPATILQQAQIVGGLLQRVTPKHSPMFRADLLNRLGIILCQLPVGDRVENIRHAIECFQGNLTVFTAQVAPLDYAGVLTNLGHAYSSLPSGDRAENLRMAIASYEEALRY